VTRPVRLAVFAASPVFYQVPLYRLLAADPRLDFTAIFASSGGTRPYEGGYGQPIAWDVDLLSGYRQVFLRKADANPIGGTALGIRDPDVVARVGEGRYDVLWLQGYATITHVLAALRQKASRRALMFREEQTLLHPRPLWKTLVKEPLLRGLLAGSYALYIGTENRRWFERYGVPAERRFPVPYVVDNDALRAAAAELAPRRGELRASFGIGPDAGPVILTVSRLIPKKQPLFLLEAFRRVRETRRCALLVVGSGECEAEMREFVARRRIPDVVLAGFLNRSEIPRAYAAADVFTLASRIHETWGIVVNEAMNFGLPLALSDKVGSATDLLEPGRNGFGFAADDPAAAADALGRLVDDPALRAPFGARSRELVGELTYRAAADGVLAAVADAVGPSRWAEASRAPSAAPRANPTALRSE
jgi:glycosyltransferase involved in cell wall biosynthesis